MVSAKLVNGSVMYNTYVRRCWRGPHWWFVHKRICRVFTFFTLCFSEC